MMRVLRVLLYVLGGLLIPVGIVGAFSVGNTTMNVTSPTGMNGGWWPACLPIGMLMIFTATLLKPDGNDGSKKGPPP